jgi:hypothetical protein
MEAEMIAPRPCRVSDRRHRTCPITAMIVACVVIVIIAPVVMVA